jgi:hypothetical protein
MKISGFWDVNFDMFTVTIDQTVVFGTVTPCSPVRQTPTLPPLSGSSAYGDESNGSYS